MADEPGTVDELRTRIQIDWAALEDVVARLSDAELTAPGPESWSVKDHLAHIGEWERASTAVMQHGSEPEAFGIEPTAYEGLDIDALNEILFQRHRNESIAEVKDFAARTHAELLAALAHLHDEDLQAPVSAFGVMIDRERTLVQKIASDSYTHYAEHTRWIQELLRAIEPTMS